MPNFDDLICILYMLHVIYTVGLVTAMAGWILRLNSLLDGKLSAIEYPPVNIR